MSSLSAMDYNIKMLEATTNKAGIATPYVNTIKTVVKIEAYRRSSGNSSLRWVLGS
jgi:hypothetical protein